MQRLDFGIWIFFRHSDLVIRHCRMTSTQAIAFIKNHGAVLASARGPLPRLAELIANEPIRGSWWAHPRSHHIFRIFQRISESPDILVCRIVNGKLTFVHRRLWPALVRAAKHFPTERLAQAGQEHTPAGYHVRRDLPFPRWVSAKVLKEAKLLTEAEALAILVQAGVAPSRVGD
jgi:hypothetical protein